LSFDSSCRPSQPSITRELEVTCAEKLPADQTLSLESRSVCVGGTGRLSWGQGLGDSHNYAQTGPEGIETVKHELHTADQKTLYKSSIPRPPIEAHHNGSRTPCLPSTCHVEWIPPLMTIAMEASEVAWHASRAAERAFQQISIEADDTRAAVAVAFARRIIASARGTRGSLRQFFSGRAQSVLGSLSATLQVIDTHIGRGRKSLRRSHSDHSNKWTCKRSMLDCLQRKGVWLQLAFKLRVGVSMNRRATSHTQIEDFSLTLQPALHFPLWAMQRERHQASKMYVLSTVPLQVHSCSLGFHAHHSPNYCRMTGEEYSILQEARGSPHICLRPSSLLKQPKVMKSSKKSTNSVTKEEHLLSALRIIPLFASEAQIQQGRVSNTYPMSDYSARPSGITCAATPTDNFFDIDVQGDCLSSWTDIEKIIFLDKFLQYPKNFNRIASFLRRKRVRDCIRLYYDSKHHINFKAVLKEHQQRKRGKLACWEATRCAVQVFGGDLKYVHGDNATWFRLPSFDQFFTGAARHQNEAGFSSAL